MTLPGCRVSDALTGYWRIVCALTLAALLAACGLIDETPTYRYRLAVEVDTPQGLKTGSSVIEVDTHRNETSWNPQARGLWHKVRGEAAAVDLGEGRVLFALLRSEDSVDWPAQILFLTTPYAVEAEDKFLATFERMLAREEAVELPPDLAACISSSEASARPMLVTFRDLADPTSVERVDTEDLAASFGEGFALRRITVQLTDDPVTEGIEDRLAWLGQLSGMGLEAEDFPENVPVGNFSGYFRSGW
jgi:hypothetical protein